MDWRKTARVMLPFIIALAAIAGLYLNAARSRAETPQALNGVVDLASWNRAGAFAVTGQWEFYWGRLLDDARLESGAEAYAVVPAPGEWNYYETGLGELPGQGRATYRVRVTGAQAGTEYGLRIQDLASAYRLYADGELLAQNGSFGDRSNAPVSAYRPQLAAFTPRSDSFDIILQVSNDAYAVGGMWKPLIFGPYGQVAKFDRLLSAVGIASLAGLLVMCLFFCLLYATRRQEKELLILAGIGLAVMLRLMISGDMAVSYLFPAMPIAGFGWIDYLTLLWLQFLLMYFVYCAYGGLVRKWQIVALFAYSAGVSFLVLLLPLEVFTSAYILLNCILLFVIGAVTAQLARAAWRGRRGASALLGALAFMLLLVLYDAFSGDWSIGYNLLNDSAVDCLLLFFVQCCMIARRYNHAQKLELSFLKGQIRPHFIHNSLTGIITLARTDPGRTRELLQNLSSYLRGFYDFEGDDLIPLRQELEFVRAYASLEQMRFGEKVGIDYQMESDAILLPPLILQPLVENAFVHGLREKQEGGTVVVYAQKTKAGQARVGVRDNGLGFGAKPAKFSRRGVAIENINRRLARLYRTQLVFTAPEGGGCEVYMEIPWKEEARHESLPD